MSIDDLLRRNVPTRYVEALQRKHPPHYYRSQESWRALFGGALGLSTEKLRKQVEAGVIASGEVGKLTPETYAMRRGRGYVVVMHSGEIRLIYSAARALTATDDGRFREDKQAGLSPDDVATQIADLFRNYDEHEMATAQSFPATPFHRGWADVISRGAEHFILMHELAHIHNGDLASSGHCHDGIESKQGAEVAADAVACQWMVNYILHPTPSGPQRQVLYAGAEFALRIRMAMETCGMRFESTHPSPSNRVAAMRERLRKATDQRTFYAVAGTAISFDQMWRAVESILCKEVSVFERTLDDVLAGLRMLTVEYVAAGKLDFQISNGPERTGEMQLVLVPANIAQQEILVTAQDDFRDVPPNTWAEVKQRAGELFESGSVEFSLFLGLVALSETPRRPK